MEAQELYRGRLIDHIGIVVRDYEASKRFYQALMGVLGIPLVEVTDDFFYADEFCVSSAGSAAADGKLTGRIHIAFQARDREMVEAFHAAGLKAGGKDNGAPGERAKYHPGYYAAFLPDPDGNNVEAVFHGPATKSAEAVKITW